MESHIQPVLIYKRATHVGLLVKYLIFAYEREFAHMTAFFVFRYIRYKSNHPMNLLRAIRGKTIRLMAVPDTGNADPALHVVATSLDALQDQQFLGHPAAFIASLDSPKLACP